ncbi:MAG: hypothetical protein K5790_01750 [Nitrosopumilus sp.]|uniref:hypothetical protein n=1 Tax=Nitrosopumilus sp. TaxID=2024843 RepID=UPI00247DD157|nr:hypothetical protein [Nitrosopumilus sp.]MCV0391998.1 hypothetical protein [Nitrosopumilus sp.]
MKTSILAIIGIITIISIGLFLILLQIQFADVAPCFDKEQNRHVPCRPETSIQFYEYKGEEWMETKKQEMIESMLNNTFHAWIDQTKDDHSHWNVYQYYSYTEDLSKQILDLKGIDSGSYSTIPSKLQKIYNYCFNDSIGLGVLDIYLSYTNQTHFIDNNTCEWQLLENYPNSDSLCIPWQHVENNEHRIRNGTHIFNNDTCMWEILETCTGYCGEK